MARRPRASAVHRGCSGCCSTTVAVRPNARGVPRGPAAAGRRAPGAPGSRSGGATPERPPPWRPRRSSGGCRGAAPGSPAPAWRPATAGDQAGPYAAPPPLKREAALIWAPSVASVDEPADDEDGCGQAERSVAMAWAAVGVAAELPVVRPPGVGGLYDPSEPEAQRLPLDARHLGAAALDLDPVDAGDAEPVPHCGGVVTPRRRRRFRRSRIRAPRRPRHLVAGMLKVR